MFLLFYIYRKENPRILYEKSLISELTKKLELLNLLKPTGYVMHQPV